MNPYLEQADTWEDFHESFIVHARDVLSARVGGNYLVKVEVRLYLHELSSEERRHFGRADVAVTAPPSPASAPAGTSVLAAPMELLLPAVDVVRHSSMEIRDRRNRRLVTVVELLSPTNKTAGPDYEAYVGKRQSLLAGPTHLVEIDLRRGGLRPSPPELPTCDYYVLVSRYEDRPRVGLWPLRLRESLPAVPIPLSPPDPAVSLDLQALLHQVYDAANYGKYVYLEDPEPPLAPDDAVWARQLVPRNDEPPSR
jgi:hypothetical protein